MRSTQEEEERAAEEAKKQAEVRLSCAVVFAIFIYYLFLSWKKGKLCR